MLSPFDSIYLFPYILLSRAESPDLSLALKLEWSSIQVMMDGLVATLSSIPGHILALGQEASGRLPDLAVSAPSWIASTYADWLCQTNVGTDLRWSCGISFSLSILWHPWWRRCLVSLLGGGLKCNCHQNRELCRAVLKLLAKEKGVCTCL